jgi:hypothetical protein
MSIDQLLDADRACVVAGERPLVQLGKCVMQPLP